MAKMLLPLPILLGAWMLWFQGISPLVPEQYKFAEQYAEPYHVMLMQSVRFISDPNAQDSLVNDMKNLMMVDENNERHADQAVIDKYKNVKLPGSIQQALDKARGAADSKRAQDEAYMNHIDQ